MSDTTEFLAPMRPISILEIDGWPSLIVEVTSPNSIIFYSTETKEWSHEDWTFHIHRVWVTNEVTQDDGKSRTLWSAYEYPNGKHFLITNKEKVPGKTSIAKGPFTRMVNEAIDKAALRWISDPRNQRYFDEASVFTYHETLEGIRSSITNLEANLVRMRKRLAETEPLYASALARLPEDRSRLWPASLVSQEHEGDPCTKKVRKGR